MNSRIKPKTTFLFKYDTNCDLGINIVLLYKHFQIFNFIESWKLESLQSLISIEIKKGKKINGQISCCTLLYYNNKHAIFFPSLFFHSNRSTSISKVCAVFFLVVSLHFFSSIPLHFFCYSFFFSPKTLEV